MSGAGASRVAIAGLALGLILVGPLSRSLPAEANGELQMARAPAGCSEGTLDGAWQPRNAGPDDVRAASFECGDLHLQVNAALWRSQGPGREAVSDANRLLPEAWRFNVRSRRIDSVLGHEVAEHAVDLGEEVWVIWAWYVIGETPVAFDLGAKAYEALNAARFVREPAARLSVAVRASSLEAARRGLAARAASVQPRIVASVPPG